LKKSVTSACLRSCGFSISFSEAVPVLLALVVVTVAVP
jgi:hypothetical protein